MLLDTFNQVGECKDDRKSGNGTFFSKDRTKYVGEFENDVRDGIGKETIYDKINYMEIDVG